MTTRHLKIFLNVYITGSMTAAAQKLYMTQPSVSQAIRELEEECGLTADCVVDLHPVYPSVGYDTEVIHMYLATGLHETKCHPDEDEFLDRLSYFHQSVLSSGHSGGNGHERRNLRRKNRCGHSEGKAYVGIRKTAVHRTSVHRRIFIFSWSDSPALRTR
mgnify:CR=1 FL=1